MIFQTHIYRNFYQCIYYSSKSQQWRSLNEDSSISEHILDFECSFVFSKAQFSIFFSELSTNKLWKIIKKAHFSIVLLKNAVFPKKWLELIFWEVILFIRPIPNVSQQKNLARLFSFFNRKPYHQKTGFLRNFGKMVKFGVNLV